MRKATRPKGRGLIFFRQEDRPVVVFITVFAAFDHCLIELADTPYSPAIIVLEDLEIICSAVFSNKALQHRDDLCDLNRG